MSLLSLEALDKLEQELMRVGNLDRDAALDILSYLISHHLITNETLKRLDDAR